MVSCFRIKSGPHGSDLQGFSDPADRATAEEMYPQMWMAVGIHDLGTIQALNLSFLHILFVVLSKLHLTSLSFASLTHESSSSFSP